MIPNATDHEIPVGGNLITGNGQGGGRDSDPDGDTLTVTTAGGEPVAPDGTTTRGSNGGTFIIRPDGTYDFSIPAVTLQSPALGSVATTTITYTIVDADGATATATLTITVQGPAVPMPPPVSTIDSKTPAAEVIGSYGYLEGEQLYRRHKPGAVFPASDVP